MHAIKEARKYIQSQPADASAQVLARLILALESEASFPISEIYSLDYPRFELALQIIAEWRLDRFYAGKAKLFDVALQATALEPESAARPAR